MEEGRLRKTVSLYLSLLQEGDRRPAASFQEAFIECCRSLSSQRLAVIFSPPLFISVLALCAIAFVVRLVVTQSLTSGRSCLLSLCLILACEVGAFSLALQLHFCDS